VRRDHAAALEREPRATVTRADLRAPGEVARLFQGRTYAGIVNATGLGPEGVRPLLRQAGHEGSPFTLQLSTGALYGPEPEPALRARETEPVDPGGDPALEAARAAEEAVLTSGIPSAVLRIFTLVAPYMPPNRFPMDAVEAILSNEDVHLPNDEPVDLVSAGDAARGVALALEARPEGRILNIGSGIGTPPRFFVDKLAEQLGTTARVVFTGAPARPRAWPIEAAWTTSATFPDGVSTLAERIARARLGHRVADDALRGLPAEQADEGPSRVSRRELFSFFRRR
jgi:nucleoside-diphosphate-sugar epimerase